MFKLCIVLEGSVLHAQGEIMMMVQTHIFNIGFYFACVECLS